VGPCRRKRDRLIAPRPRARSWNWRALTAPAVRAVPIHAGSTGGCARRQPDAFSREGRRVRPPQCVRHGHRHKPDVRFVCHATCGPMSSLLPGDRRAGPRRDAANTLTLYKAWATCRNPPPAERAGRAAGVRSEQRIERQRLDELCRWPRTRCCGARPLIDISARRRKTCGNAISAGKETSSGFRRTRSIAQKAMSAICAPASDFGRGAPDRHLWGERARNVCSSHSDGWPTFGVGGAARTGEWRSIYRQLRPWP